MSVVGGYDLHPQQITFDYAVRGTGEVTRGRIAPADRESLRAWLGRLDGGCGAFVTHRGQPQIDAVVPTVPWREWRASESDPLLH